MPRHEFTDASSAAQLLSSTLLAILDNQRQQAQLMGDLAKSTANSIEEMIQAAPELDKVFSSQIEVLNRLANRASSLAQSLDETTDVVSVISRWPASPPLAE
jgi:hypothetical protein